jgi:hypothetical protein
MGEQIPDLPRVDRRSERAGFLAAHRRERESGNRLDNPIEFEGPQGAWLHRCFSEALPHSNEAGNL